MKQRAGTMMVTSVGMVGSGAGWGGCLAGDRVEEREHLCLTVSFDHDIVDGAPAARYLRRSRKLIDSGAVLPQDG